jgi:acyl phosphate:glycerol-3-phosphate acyltransferase
MSPLTAAILLLVVAYLLGAIPFGYLIGRARGVDLFKAGSGNIGATNAGRVLGRKIGTLVFLLDFLKGALPVAIVLPLARALAPGADTALGPPDVLRVATAALTFLGHLFPIYLGFRGGKGIATGAGTMFVLVPGPTALALLAWIVVLFATRIVSLASLVAATILLLTRLMSIPSPFESGSLPVTLYLLAATLMVVIKHRSNVRRLVAGNENRIGDFTMRQPILRMIHVLALGLWFGGAAFFNFIAAVPIFESFKEVVAGAPSDRTALVNIIPPGTTEEQKKDLASALAGAAVGPVFPRYFAMQAVCGLIAFMTALNWWNAEGGCKLHRWRVYLIGAAFLTVLVGSALSNTVSELRLQRFSPDPGAATAARESFTAWHLASLFLSIVTVCLAGAALALAAWLPDAKRRDEGVKG